LEKWHTTQPYKIGFVGSTSSKHRHRMFLKAPPTQKLFQMATFGAVHGNHAMFQLVNCFCLERRIKEKKYCTL